MKNSTEGIRQDYEIILHNLFIKKTTGDNKALALTMASITSAEDISVVSTGMSKYLASVHGLKTLLINNKGQQPKDGTIFFDALNIKEITTDKVLEHTISANFTKIELFNTDSFRFYFDEDWLVFWDKLKCEFDVIIVNAASFQSVIPISWNQITNQTVLVIDAQKVTKQVLARFKVEIESNGFNINGFILNNRSYPIPNFVYKKMIKR